VADDHNFAAEMVGPRIALEGSPVAVVAHHIVVESYTAFAVVAQLGVGHMD